MQTHYPDCHSVVEIGDATMTMEGQIIGTPPDAAVQLSVWAEVRD